MQKYNYKQASFYTTVNDLNSLPAESTTEIAIVGRSNSGKSSLLNTLANQNRLAFTSKTVLNMSAPMNTKTIAVA